MDIFDCINSPLTQLSHIRRYAAIPVHRIENVAEHSFYCAFYSSLIARDLIKQGYDLDHGTVVMKALHHDLEEAVTGDIIRSFKYITSELREEIARASEIAMYELSDQMGEQNHSTYETWLHSKDDSPEGKVVALADQLCLIAYIREEILNGNKHLHPVAKRAQEHIRKAAVGHLESYYKQVYPNDKWDDILRD